LERGHSCPLFRAGEVVWTMLVRCGWRLVGRDVRVPALMFDLETLVLRLACFDVEESGGKMLIQFERISSGLV